MLRAERNHRSRFAAITAGAAIVLGASAAVALPGMSRELKPLEPRPQVGLPPQLENVAFDQKLDAQIPLDVVFRDETGAERPLASFFDGKPVVLLLAYYECPMLCTMTLNGLVGALEALKFDAGREFDVLVVSFDARETSELAAQKKQTVLDRYRRPTAAEGWHFLTGEEASIEALTDAVGFQFAWDEPAKEWAHAAGVVVLTPQGRVAKYFYGIEYPPKEIRLALVESAEGRIGTFVDQVLLYCFHYDPSTGRYGAAVVNIIRAGGILTLLAIGLFFLAQSRRGRARKMATVGG